MDTRQLKVLVQKKYGAPEDKAEWKAASIPKGIAYLVLGAVLLLGALGSFGFALVKLVDSPDKSLVIFSGIVFVVTFITGLYFVFGGGHVMSGETLDAAADDVRGLVGILGKLTRWARGRNGNGAKAS